MNGCVFCNIITGRSEATLVCRDDVITAFMDIQPINTGHVLIVPNAHIAFINQLDDVSYARIFQWAQKISKAIRQSSLRCEGINYFLADGQAAGQEIFHVHLHVIPRFHGDGHVWKMSDAYYDLPTRSELNSAAEKIRCALQ